MKLSARFLQLENSSFILLTCPRMVQGCPITPPAVLEKETKEEEKG